MKEKTPPLWLKILAYLFDYTLLFLLTCTIFVLTPFVLGNFMLVSLLLAIPIRWILLEVVFLKIWGTTPGKALLGIHLEKKPTWKQAFLRGLTAPFFLTRKGQEKWNRLYGKEIYVLKKKLWRFVGYALLYTAILSPFVLIDDFQNTLQGTLFNNETSFLSLIKPSKPHEDLMIEWHSFTSPNKDFKVKFPGKPSCETRNLKIPNSTNVLPYTEYKCAYGEHTYYSLSYTTLPDGWLRWSSGLILKGTLKVITKQLGGTKIIYRDLKKVGKYPGLHFVLLKGNAEIQGMLILVKNVLYKIEGIYPPELRESHGPNLSSFLYSFTPISPQR